MENTLFPMAKSQKKQSVAHLSTERKTDDIGQCLIDKIDQIIKWGCSVYDIPVLIVNMKWTFSGRYTVSYVCGSKLKYTAFFALHDFFETWESGGTFYESSKRVNSNPVIRTFAGSGYELLIALLCHEMAHIFESISLQDSVFHTKVMAYHNIVVPKTKMRHHHNALWRIIYSDLKIRFMPPSNKTIIDNSIEVIKVKNHSGVDFYARMLDKHIKLV